MRWRPGWIGRTLFWWIPEEPPWRIAWVPRRVYRDTGSRGEVTVWLERYRAETRVEDAGRDLFGKAYHIFTDRYVWDGRGWRPEDFLWYVWFWARVAIFVGLVALMTLGIERSV